MSRNTCPTHTRYEAEDCPICERLITAVEDDSGREGDWQSAVDRYERWLDEIGGSR